MRPAFSPAYSHPSGNTGGQASKATPRSTQAKFAMDGELDGSIALQETVFGLVLIPLGKATPKKDLGSMMMSYGGIPMQCVVSF